MQRSNEQRPTRWAPPGETPRRPSDASVTYWPCAAARVSRLAAGRRSRGCAVRVRVHAVRSPRTKSKIVVGGRRERDVTISRRSSRNAQSYFLNMTRDIHAFTEVRVPVQMSCTTRSRPALVCMRGGRVATAMCAAGRGGEAHCARTEQHPATTSRALSCGRAMRAFAAHEAGRTMRGRAHIRVETATCWQRTPWVFPSTRGRRPPWTSSRSC